MIEVEAHPNAPSPEALAAARTVYVDAFSGPPYDEPPGAGSDFVERVERYATTRDGFRLYLARSGETVVGLVLAVVAHPGDWWREQVADAIGAERASEVLGEACVEVVHVAVSRREQSRGIGRALMAAVHREALAPRGILGVHPDAPAAQALYRRSGWTVLTTDFRLAGGPPSWLMRRRLGS